MCCYSMTWSFPTTHLQQSLVKIRTPSFSPDFARPPSRSPAVQYPILEWQIDRMGWQAGMPLCSSERRSKTAVTRTLEVWAKSEQRREMVLGRRRISPLKKMNRDWTTLRCLGCGNSGLERRILLKDNLNESREGGQHVSNPVSKDTILDRVMKYVGCFRVRTFLDR
jgi:hypothetical protein